MKGYGGSLYRVNAIVVKAYSFGENDRIVTLFTDRLGIIQAIAKGARKIKSHLLSATVPFSEGSYLLYKGRSLYTITQFDFKETHNKIARDMECLTCAEYLVELSMKVGTEYTDDRLYMLFKDGLKYLDNGIGEPELLVYAFSLWIMKLNGLKPNLISCTQCYSSVDDGIWFSAEAGGVLCSKCHLNYADSFRIDRSTISVCRYMEEHQFSFLSHLNILKRTRVEIDKVIKSLIRYYIDPDIRTLELLSTGEYTL
jgi:DNA repair protein RecO